MPTPSKQQIISSELIEQSQSGDESAINQLVAEYDSRLRFLARIYTSNAADADDVTQIAWLKIIKNLSSLKNTKGFDGWCKRIVENTAIDFYKSPAESTSRTVVFTDLGNEDEGLEYDPQDETISSQPELNLSEQETRNMIIEILDSLPEDQRIVVSMHCYEGTPLREIADRLGIPMSSVTGRYQRAKVTIKSKVEDMEKTNGIRLYGMAPLPFFLYLLRYENRYSWIVGSTAATSAGVTGAAAKAAAGAGSKATAGATAKVVGSAGAKTAADFWTAGRVGAVIAIGAAASAYPVYQAIVASKEPININVAEYMNVSFSGFNGTGSGSVYFNESENGEITQILNSGSCIVDGSGYLFNGSSTSVTCTYDEDALLEQGYTLSNTSINTSVSGLLDYAQLDLFDGVSVQWAVDQDAHTADVEIVTTSSVPDGVFYSITKNDGEGNVIVHASADYVALQTQGIEILGNQFDKAFSIGNQPETYMNERVECTDSDGKWNSATHSCSYAPATTQTTTVYVEPPEESYIMGLARAYVGAPGICDHIAWAFIRDLYGIDISGYQNCYDVDSVAPGDLVLYYDDYGQWRHVSVYLGDGIVLAGNYLDGTAHIVPLNASFYSTKSFMRVAR